MRGVKCELHKWTELMSHTAMLSFQALDLSVQQSNADSEGESVPVHAYQLAHGV